MDTLAGGWRHGKGEVEKGAWVREPKRRAWCTRQLESA